MRWLRFAVLILVASILQTSLMDALHVMHPAIKPDLMLILLVFFATRSTPRDAVITSFTIGFVADLVSPTMGLMGPQIISFGLLGTLLSDVHTVISTRRAVYQMVAIFLTGVLAAAIGYLLIFLRGEVGVINPYARLLWQPLYSALLGPLLFVPTGWWMRMNRKAGRYRRRSPFARR